LQSLPGNSDWGRNGRLSRGTSPSLSLSGRLKSRNFPSRRAMRITFTLSPVCCQLLNYSYRMTASCRMNGNGRSALFCREPACSGNPRRVSGMEIRQRTGHLGIGAAGELSVLSADITNGLRKRQSETNATNDHETCRPILIHTRSKTLLIAGNAGAGSTTRSTNTAGMEFVAANIGINDLTADSTSGQARTLLFTADASSVTGFPYKIDCGDFLLICAACTTTPTTIFDGFTFDLAIDNTTHGAIGEFVGTSSPGAVSGNTRTIVVSRVPLPPDPVQATLQWQFRRDSLRQFGNHSVRCS